MRYLLITLLLLLPSLQVAAQVGGEGEKIRILFIFDASNSMNATWQTQSRIAVARKLMTKALDSLKGFENIEMGLRIYGHQTRIMPGQQDCEDTKLEIPIGSTSETIDKIKLKIKGVECKGTTPLARSLLYAANDFPKCDGKCRDVIILITDGIEACDEDPCAVAKVLHEKGIKLRPFIIGLGLDMSYMDMFKCIGNFYDASTEDLFQGVLKVVLSQALNNTTIQVNLNDTEKKPKESDVAMSFTDAKTGRILYNFVHTLNHKKLPDTLTIDPLAMYNLTVHTIPPIYKENIKLVPGKHNIIELDAPQGKLNLKIHGQQHNPHQIKAIVRKEGEARTLNIQSFSTEVKMLTGNYSLEIMILPALIMDNVKINQSKLTNITIPHTGLITFENNKPIVGDIFYKKDGKLEWVYKFDSEKSFNQLVFQPGDFIIIYRQENANTSVYTVEKAFTVKPGDQYIINL
ncbi:MAG: vWA domain-containing protein [Flavobacteriales bacterium]